MCGRFTLATNTREFARVFGVPADAIDADALAPRFNVAPRQTVPAVVAEDGGRVVRRMEWGLVPAWAKDPAKGPRPINARGETAASKPTFRTPFRRRRCLIPATGFYEWKPDPGEPGGPKTPHLFRLADPGGGGDAGDARGLFAFAGLWDRRDGGGGGPLETFTILTRPPYSAVAPVHDRSPLILPPGLFGPWLDPDLTDPAGVAAVLADAGEAELTATVVTTAVNSPRNDGPHLIEPVAGSAA